MSSDQVNSKRETDDEAEPQASAGLVRRTVGWAGAHRLMVGLLGGGFVLTALIAGAGMWLWLGSSGEEERVALAEALDALDGGYLAEARRVAEIFAKQRHTSIEEAGGAAFVLGAVAYYETEDSFQENKRNGFLRASRYLEEANDRGFPPGRQAEGLRLLGRSLFLSGRVSASRAVLLDALRDAKSDETRIELERLLADAYLLNPLAKLDEALKFNDRLLSRETISADDRGADLLQRAKILLGMNRPDGCLAALDKIPDGAKHRAEAGVVRGRVLMREAESLTIAAKKAGKSDSESGGVAKQKYEAAIECFRAAQGSDTLKNAAAREAAYLIGACFQQLQNYRAAADQFRRVQTVFPDTAEAAACDFHQAELARRHGRDEAVLTAYGRLKAAIADPAGANNPWFSLEEVRRSLLEAHRHYLETQNFEICLQLARIAHPLIPKDQAIALAAETYRNWGDGLIARAAHMPPVGAAAARQNGRKNLRRAGMIYSQLADMHVATEQYADDIWTASECFMRGQNYDDAIYELKKYLDNESRRRSPQALVNLGKAYLALGKTDEALEHFEKCIDYHPKNAESYDARLWAARTYREKGDAEKAEESLLRIIAGEGIMPSSAIWQEAIFDLGELEHARGEYAEAIRRLEEAVQRMPESPRAMLSRYLIADSYRARARAEREKRRKILAESALVAPPGNIAALLKSAQDRYKEVRDMLDRRQSQGELYGSDREILRNSYMGAADMLFEMEEYERAVEEYSLVISRYKSRPFVLQAYLQTARAQRRLGRADESLRTLKRAKSVLERMSDGGELSETTNMNKEQWAKLFDRLASEAEAIGRNIRTDKQYSRV